MNSNVTIALLRSLLCNSNTGFSDPADAGFVPAVNQVMQRFVESGKWKGNIEKVVFGVPTVNFITLPPQFVSVLAGAYGCWPGVPIWSQFHEFMECGPGTFELNSWYPYQFVDMGDLFATQFDVTIPGNAQVTSAPVDNGAVVRIFGINQATGLPAIDTDGNFGVNIVLNYPIVQMPVVFTAITGIQKPMTKAPIGLWINPGGGNPSYQIATYLSVETIPQYHRYQVQNSNPPFGTSPQTAIRTLCQRRYMPAFAETDFVYPGNIGAFKWGLQALNYEDLNRSADADSSWKYAFNLLNNQSHAGRGGARVEVNVEPWGDGAGGLPWTN